jgi:hypothetical protein
VVTPKDRECLEDAQANIAAATTLNAGKRRPKLVDMRSVPKIDREARAYYSGEEAARFTSAIALLVGSPVTQVIANFFISINQPPVPTKLFTSEAEAVMWLKNFIEAPSSLTVTEMEDR